MTNFKYKLIKKSFQFQVNTATLTVVVSEMGTVQTPQTIAFAISVIPL